MTVLDDVCFGPMNFGKTRQEAEEISRRALLDVGIEESIFHKSPFELSGGQRRRAAIAGILAMEPEYFVLDEPTAGLDPAGRDQIICSVLPVSGRRSERTGLYDTGRCTDSGRNQRRNYGYFKKEAKQCLEILQ